MVLTANKILSCLQTVRDKCFAKCIGKPSSTLSSSDQQCLARCCDRYADVRRLHFAVVALNSHIYMLHTDHSYPVMQATKIVTQAVLSMSGLE